MDLNALWSGGIAGLFRWIIVTVIAMLLGINVSGCGKPNVEPMERLADRTITEVVKPTVTELTAAVKTAAGQAMGGIQGINPGYSCNGHVYWVGAGLDWNLTIQAIGLAGQFMGAAQMQGTRDPTPKPAPPEPPKPTAASTETPPATVPEASPPKMALRVTPDRLPTGPPVPRTAG